MVFGPEIGEEIGYKIGVFGPEIAEEIGYKIGVFGTRNSRGNWLLWDPVFRSRIAEEIGCPGPGVRLAEEIGCPGPGGPNGVPIPQNGSNVTPQGG